MDMQALQIPDHAKDIRLNLGKVLEPEHLTPSQLWGTVLATTLVSRNARLSRELGVHAESKLREWSDRHVPAARTAASLMAMNNVYYRSMHLIGDRELASFPARLRMQGLANHGVDRCDFELWCLAVSAVNGCGKCLESHTKAVLEAGATKAVVHEAIRVASVVHAAAVTLDQVDDQVLEPQPVG